MRRRRLLIVFVVLALATALGAAVGVVATSSASFTDSSSSSVAVSTADVSSLLHLYSESTDPDHLTSYYRRTSPSGLAATGVDMSLVVNLGRQPSSNTTQTRVFTIQAASTLPSGITSITVTATLVADPGGIQPITGIGFANIGGTGRTNPITLTAGQKRQCNMRTNMRKLSGAYHPTIILTITYSGFSGTLFRYSVPVTVLSPDASITAGGLESMEEELPSMEEGLPIEEEDLDSEQPTTSENQSLLLEDPALTSE